MESIDLLNVRIIETDLLPKGMSIGMNDGKIYVGIKEATSVQRDDFKGDNDANIEIRVK